MIEIKEYRIMNKLRVLLINLFSRIHRTSVLKTSELDFIIPPEIKDDEFYSAIMNLAEKEEIQTVLEIGSSSGNGSTEAFVNGLVKNPCSPHLYCLEISSPRFNALQKRYKNVSFITCYNFSSVPIDKFPSEGEVAYFYKSVPSALNKYPLERVLSWLKQDIEYIEKSKVPTQGIQKIKKDNNIQQFDMVLIDGSEFTGREELNEIYGAKIILLDDINGFKNYHSYQRLSVDPNYVLIQENWKIRNGYAIYKRKSSFA